MRLSSKTWRDPQYEAILHTATRVMPPPEAPLRRRAARVMPPPERSFEPPAEASPSYYNTPRSASSFLPHMSTSSFSSSVSQIEPAKKKMRLS